MMFREALIVAVPLAAAETRLAARLAVDRLQPEASSSSAEAAEVLMRAGFGLIRKQVSVLTLPPYTRDDTVVFPIRWEATGPAGGLFPALDANHELSPATDQDGSATTEVTFIGSYRPPLGSIGKDIDQAVLTLAAQATIRSFLHHLPHVLDPQPTSAPLDITDTLTTPDTEPT